MSPQKTRREFDVRFMGTPHGFHVLWEGRQLDQLLVKGSIPDDTPMKLKEVLPGDVTLGLPEALMLESRIRDALEAFRRGVGSDHGIQRLEQALAILEKARREGSPMTDGPFKPQGDDPAYHAVEVQCDGCGLTTVQSVECDARAQRPQGDSDWMNRVAADQASGEKDPIVFRKVYDATIHGIKAARARAQQPEVEKLVEALKSLIEINDFEIRNRVWQEQWKAERFTKAREALRTVKGDK